MKKMRGSSVWIVLLILLFLQAGCSEETPPRESDSPAFDEYDFVARGRMSRDRGLRPADIVRLDNNGEILLGCVEPKSAEDLQSTGTKFIRSQLELLTDWSLLKYNAENKTYQTAVHVYGPEKSSAIRSLVSSGVERLADEMETDLAALRSYLQESGREKSLFAVLYAYILHGYSMDRFGPEIYQKPQLSAEHPFWDGFSWAVYPVRKFQAGPTHLQIDGVRVFFVRGEAVQSPGFRQLMSFAQDVAADGRIDDPEIIGAFADFDVADELGNLTVAVFEGEWSVKLEGMARSVYDETVRLTRLPDMENLLGMSSPVQAEMFIHYEVRYAFLLRLLDEGAVMEPFDFEDAARNKPTDVGNLIFLIRPEGPES
jgi:hypothetical protein